MKKIFLLIALGIMVSAGAQTVFEVPQNLELKTEADYARYEADVIKAAKWLEETDLDKEEEKREKVSAFVVTWLTGSPKVAITLNPGLVNHIRGNLGLLSIYMASYARYCLEHTGALEKDAKRFALESIAKVYQKKIGIKKDKLMEKLAKAIAEGKLEEYVVKKQL